MRVGFDVSPLYRPHSPGIQRLVRELVPRLQERGRLEVMRLSPMKGEDPRRWRHREVARLVRKHELVGFHSFFSSIPWRGVPRVVQTVHELPWLHGVRENAGLKHRFWARAGGLFADRILCGTERVAGDLRRLSLGGAAKVRVCPWGVGPPFADEPPPGTVDEGVLGIYRLPEDPLVLCLDAVREKKNLAAVLRGLAKVHQAGEGRLHLVVTGEDTPDLRRDLGLASQLGLSRWVSTPGRIEEEHLAPLLRLASCVAVLSRSEGFGFPALEALACGTPVVVPRASAQAEVAGERAFGVDPEDPASVADGLVRAVRAREELRYLLAERARELSWERTAEQIEGVWEELAS